MESIACHLDVSCSGVLKVTQLTNICIFEVIYYVMRMLSEAVLCIIGFDCDVGSFLCRVGLVVIFYSYFRIPKLVICLAFSVCNLSSDCH